MKKTIFIHLAWGSLFAIFLCTGFKSRKPDPTPKLFSGGMFYYVNPSVGLKGLAVSVDSVKTKNVRFEVAWKEAFMGEAELIPVKFFLVKAHRRSREVIPVTGDEGDIAYNFTGDQKESILQYVKGAIGGDSIKIDLKDPVEFLSDEMWNSLK
jgi:hypothetical protein